MDFSGCPNILKLIGLELLWCVLGEVKEICTHDYGPIAFASSSTISQGENVRMSTARFSSAVQKCTIFYFAAP